MKCSRIVSLLLAVLLTITCVPYASLTVSAATIDTDAVITVREAYAKAGSKVIVDVFLENNPGILGMTLSVEYDETQAELVAVENGDCLSGMTFTMPKDLSSGCHFPWDSESVSEEDVEEV